MTGVVDAAKCGGASCGHDLPILHIGQDVLHIAVGCLEDAAAVSGFPPFGGSKKESLENRIAVLTSFLNSAARTIAQIEDEISSAKSSSKTDRR